MNNAWTIAFIAFVLGFISQLSRSLGITSTWSLIERPEQPEAVGEGSFLEALIGLANWSWAQLGSIIQMMTFQTSLPSVFSLMFTVIGFILLYIIITIIRGGAS